MVYIWFNRSFPFSIRDVLGLSKIAREIFGPHCEKTCLGFLTRSNTKQAVQPQNMTEGLKLRI